MLIKQTTAEAKLVRFIIEEFMLDLTVSDFEKERH
jgi:hypothetical protein